LAAGHGPGDGDGGESGSEEDNDDDGLSLRDGDRFIELLQASGFSRERDIAFPHKQSACMRFRRENFDGPAI
jgi:hypothetical protein